MSPEMLNWPPSRGPNPHAHKKIYVQGRIERKDLPAPPPRPAPKIEKSLIESLKASSMAVQAAGKDASMKTLLKAVGVKKTFPKGVFFGSRNQKKPLVGHWSVWYQVVDVASLSLDQAMAVIKAYPQTKEHKSRAFRHEIHLDDWWEFQPRTLWVDITYPLARGVRLTVPPILEKRECKACDARGRKAHEERIMSPGYLLWTIAKEYERIYREHGKYGVWGHAIDDLGFEGIRIDKDGVAEILMGS